MHRLPKVLVALPVSLLLALAACDNKDNGPQATTNAPVATTAATAAAPATASNVSYVIDPSNSKVEWTGQKITGKHEGSFQKFSGTIDVADGKAETAKIHLDIDMNSLTTDQEKLAGHLKSPDFFDVAKYPKATFDSTSVTAGGANGATHTITGNLDLHGQKKSISFPATVTLAGDKINAKSQFTIARKDFGVVYPGMPNDLIKDDIGITLTLGATKK